MARVRFRTHDSQQIFSHKKSKTCCMILCYASKTTRALVSLSSTYGSIVGIRSSTSLFKVAMGSPLQLAMPSISPNFWQRFTSFGRPFPTWQRMCTCPYLSHGFSIPSMYLGTLVVCLDSLNAYPTHSKCSGALASPSHRCSPFCRHP